MTIVIVTHRGPFTLPRRQIADQSNERWSRLYYAGNKLKSCENFPELREKIMVMAYRNFVGKSVVFAGFWRAEKFIALTIPKKLPPHPCNVGTYTSPGENPSFTIQPELIQRALETMDLVQGESPDEKFLAIPLVSDDRNIILGVLLLSNRLSDGREEFTPEDIEISRALGEIASEAISGLLPPQIPFTSLS